MIEERFMRRPEVEAATGLSRATIYRLMSLGDFVRPYRTGKNSVRWRQSDIQQWMNERPQARGGWLLRTMLATLQLIFSKDNDNECRARYH